MRNKLEGTKTEQALINAFAGESMARNRYTYFSSIAKKEGYEQIAAIFAETADNEKEHAKIFYKFIPEGTKLVNATYPFELGNTLENLRSAAKGEHEEWTDLYLKASFTAQDEDFIDISYAFEQVIEVEKHHEARYLKLLKNIEEKSVFKKAGEVIWICRNCGRPYTSEEAPIKCPTCNHPRGYFELICDNL